MNTFQKKTQAELDKLTPDELVKYNAELEAFKGLPDDEIQGLKLKHRAITCIIVEDYEGVLRVGYFRRPTIIELKAVKKNLDVDEFDAMLTLFNSCKVMIDPMIEQDDFLKLSMIQQLGSLMTFQNSYIKNA